ncbi:MAG: glycosyltransferase [Candidatus Nanohaloarchaea archaeon]|nr:glycosyltransferase [Candidatus Nanohaloarchaea archaeon]
MKDEVSVSVIVPAVDEEERVGSLVGQVVEQDPHELIVVDGGSDDDTREVAREKGAEVVQGPGEGPGAARNTGASHASGDILLFLDADVMLLDTEVVQDIRESFADPSNVMAVASREVDASSLRSKLFLAMVSRSTELLYRSGVFINASGRLMAVRRSVFEDVGGFDEELPYCEDHDLLYRVKGEGEVEYLGSRYVPSGRRVDEKGVLGSIREYLPPTVHYFLDRDGMVERYSFESSDR